MIIDTYLKILKYKFLLEYKDIYSKWGSEFPFINKNLVNVVKSLFNIFILISIHIVMLISLKLDIINLQYFFIVFIIIFCFSICIYKGRIQLYDDRYKLYSFLSCKLFDKNQRIKNIENVILYESINKILLLIIIFIYYIMLKITFYQIKFIDIITSINILLFSSYIMLNKIQNLFMEFINYDKKENQTNLKKYILFIFNICIYIYGILNKNIINTQTINISQNISNLKIYNINIFNNTFYLYTNVILIVINIVLYLFKPKFLSKQTTIQNLKYNKIQSYINIEFINYKNIIFKDFYQKEVKNKLGLMLIIVTIINLCTTSYLKKSILVSLIFSFLFTQYNQRYLLNKKFLNYTKLYSNSNDILKKINKQLIVIQLISNIFWVACVNELTLIFLIYILISLIFFTINISIQSFIYLKGFNLKYTNDEKIKVVEKISGGFYGIIMLILLYV